MVDYKKRLKLALYSLKEHYDPKHHKFFLKKSWLPENPNREVANMILPNPTFCSEFLVYNHKHKAVRNIHLKFVVANPTDNKKYDGSFSLSDKDLKNMLDDHHLYNNIITSDGTVLKGGGKDKRVTSHLMVISMFKGTKGMYASRPLELKMFVQQGQGYESLPYITEARDGLRTKRKFIDNRPIGHGASADSFLMYNKAGGEPDVFRYQDRPFKKWTYPWQMLHKGMRTATELKRLYPIKLSNMEEVDAAAESISDQELSVHVGIAGSGDGTHKMLKTFAMVPDTIEEIYNSYMTEAWPEHKQMTEYAARKSNQINWLKEHCIEYPLFPSYSWHKNGPLRYCHEAML